MNNPPMKVLLVEDNRADAVLLQDLLLGAGSHHFDLTWDERLTKAMDRLRSEEFAAILLDLTLPDSRGLATLAQIQNVAHAVPIIVLTGVEDEETAVRAIRQGAQDYLVKGTVDGRAIVRAIRYAIDRKRGEEALRRSEATAWQHSAEIGAYYQTAPVGLAVLDTELRFVRINERLADVSGQPVTAILGRTVGNVMPVLAPAVEPPLREVLAGGRPRLDLEVTGEAAAEPGVRRIWLANLYPLRDAAEHVIGVSVVLQDVTEMKQLQARQREAAALDSAERTALETLDSMGAGILVLGMEGRVSSANRTLATLTGYDQARTVGTDIADLAAQWLPPADRLRLEHMLDCARRGRATPLLSTTVASLNRGEVPVLVSVSFVRGAEDAPKAIILTLQNVTELRKAELQLRESEEQYRTLAEHLPAVTYIAALDESFTTLYVSPRVETILGVAAEDARRDPLWWSRRLYADDRERVLRSLRDACRSDGRFSAEYRMQTETRGVVWVRDEAAVVCDAQGRQRFLQGVILDVTGQKLGQMELARSRLQLRRLSTRLVLAEEKERRRVAEVLHDGIGQTLAVSKIRLASLREMVTDPEAAAALQGVWGLFDEMIGQVRTLTFELSPPILYQLGLRAAVEWLAERLGRQLGIRFDVTAASELPTLPEALSVLVFQCVRELFANIGKHAQAHHVTVQLAVAAQQLMVEVKDDGVGFDVAPRQAQAGETPSFGLFSVRERVSHLGGHVEIVSAPGRGTAVTLVVPLTVAPVPCDGEIPCRAGAEGGSADAAFGVRPAVQQQQRTAQS